ncbi:MAG: glycerol-3-phosphate dehydrogenase [Rhizobiales bacterium]|nr:glycerol-3-phosphate dehydrogenase [Hyphomicrobiales bacterium]
MSVAAILGAGVMGSAMCMPLADRGHTVRLTGTHLDEMIIESVRANGLHPKLNVTLPKQIAPFQHVAFAEAASGADLIVLGVSSAGIGWAIDRLCDVLPGPVPILMITKGMHPQTDTLHALPDYVERELKRRRGFDAKVSAIAGPCIAGELGARRHTGTVIVSRDMSEAQRLAEMLKTEYYHPRASEDMMGVELNAAFKNFFAIAVGWAAGRLETLPPAENRAFNHNAAAIVFSQAIKELAMLTRALGGREDTAYGMPGAGDLYVTCMAGRNSRLGNNLGRGLTYKQTKDGPMKGDTIEGAELGAAVAVSLRSMMDSGLLKQEELPLTVALLDALTRDAPLDIPFARLHP